MSALRIGIAGCGRAARIHLERLCDQENVIVVGCADSDPQAAHALASQVPPSCRPDTGVLACSDHADLLKQAAPDALAIFTPPRAHYRPAMDALQAGCHVFIEKPLSTNAQEAADITALARARGRVVAVGHQYRLSPSLGEARRRLADGAIGRLRLVTATMALPWLGSLAGPEDAWRLDPKVAGGGLLADAGDHLLDALLWTTGRSAEEVAAFQDRDETGIDLVTAAAISLMGGIPATLALAAVAPDSLFELTLHGESGRLRATELRLEQDGGTVSKPWVPPAAPPESIDADFLRAVRGDGPPCCPAEAAIETVRLLEAITRSAASGQIVRPS